MLAAAALAGSFAVRATSWAVMTDELQIAKLATSIAERLSPVPYIHGRYYGALSQLYPLVIAPFYGALSPPAAETAAHALNAALLASAAWPAYLLARAVTASSAASYVAAALTVFTPWLVLASTLLTENAAYPAFVWAVFLCHRALVKSSAARDLGALAGLCLAFFARTQLFVLAVALPVAVLLHDVGFALAERRGRSRRNAMRVGLRHAVVGHRVLAVAYSIATVGAAALALRGSLGHLVGNYAVPFSGSLLPTGIWHSAAAHFDRIVVAAGVLPFLLAAAWTLLALLRPERKEGHAFALLLILVVPLLTFEVASFDLRFTPHQFVQDRYLFYLVPLFAVGAAAALAQRTHRGVLALLAVDVGGFFAWLVGFASYDDRTLIFWASPGSAFHPAISTAADWVRLSSPTFLYVAVLVLALALAAALWRAPTFALGAVGAAVAGFGAFEAGYVLVRYADPAMTRPSLSERREWIDAAVPEGRSVALVPSPKVSQVFWWEAEFWNRDVDRVLRVGSGPTYTPFPADEVSVDFTGGTLRGSQPSDYLVVSPTESRFHVQGKTVARGARLWLVRVVRPYRLDWAARGLTADGWTRPGRTAAFRFYARGRPGARMLVLTLSASRFAPRPLGFTLRTRGDFVQGGVDPGGARPPVRLQMCVPPRGFAEASLTTEGRARIPDGRVVALHVDRVQVRSGRTRCWGPRSRAGRSGRVASPLPCRCARPPRRTARARSPGASP